MADQLLDATTTAEKSAAEAKKAYRPPVLVKLGNLRDLTMSKSNVGANDGMPSKGTKRGGNFESSDCGR